MFMKDFIDFFGSKETVYLQDLSDKVNSTLTPLIMLIISTLIAYKTYIISPMDCFVSNSPSGLNFEHYVTSYCWVEGTYFIPNHQETPWTDKDWKDKKHINYYPWIPIILGIQGAMCYLPKLFWKEYCSFTAGTDLQNLVVLSVHASKMSIAARNEPVKDIAGIIEAMFHLHRDNRHGTVAKAKRKLSRKFPVLVWGKRTGNMVFGFYLLIKGLYIFIAFVQLCLMSRFLDLDNKFSYVSYDIFNYLYHGNPWNATIYFPRVTFCRVENIRAIGVLNNIYTAQCTLPINILNEKIFLFLFIWMHLLIAISVIFCLNWLCLLLFKEPKRKIIKDYLKGRNSYKSMDKPYIDKFIFEFLRLDGIFLLKMIRSHAGDVLTANVTEQLWNIFKAKYGGMNLANPDSLPQCENLALRLEPGEQKATMKQKNQYPSAPEENVSGFL